MASLKTFIKDLRRAADTLEALLGADIHTEHETESTAKEIRRTLVKKKKFGPRKLHWTQMKKNKARLRAMRKKNGFGGVNRQ
jgi:hypothetical protein